MVCANAPCERYGAGRITAKTGSIGLESVCLSLTLTFRISFPIPVRCQTRPAHTFRPVCPRTDTSVCIHNAPMHLITYLLYVRERGGVNGGKCLVGRLEERVDTTGDVHFRRACHRVARLRRLYNSLYRSRPYRRRHCIHLECREVYTHYTVYPIQSNTNKRAQVFIFARIFYNITYELKHLRFQLTRNENRKEHLDQARVCLDDF